MHHIIIRQHAPRVRTVPIIRIMLGSLRLRPIVRGNVMQGIIYPVANAFNVNLHITARVMASVILVPPRTAINIILITGHVH